MADLGSFIETNRDTWNEFTAVHAKSDFYDLEGFESGKSSLAKKLAHRVN